MYVNYADLVFKLACDDNLVFAKSDEAHQPFFITSSIEQQYDFLVTVELNKFILDGSYKPIFVVPNSSWELYEKDSHYYFVGTFPGKDKPDWVFRLDLDNFDIRIFCGQEPQRSSDGKLVIQHPFCYPLDQALTMVLLLHNQGMILHAAGVDFNGRGYVFPGRSGAGKSTVSNLCIDNGIKNWLSDDRIIVRKIGDKYYAYGSPWPGTANIAVNGKVELKGMVFVSRGEGAVLKPLTLDESLNNVFPIGSIPWYNKSHTDLAFDFIEGLVKCIPAYGLCYKPGKESFQVIKTFMENDYGK